MQNERKSLKVISLNFSDAFSGAGRAAYRIHSSISVSGVDAQMIVAKSYTGDSSVQSPESSLDKVKQYVREQLGALLVRILSGSLVGHRSLAVLPSGLHKILNSSKADLVHLHWTNGEMLSVADITRIRLPILWTLHDMWAFCGAEHYATNDRWQDGYAKNKGNGFDVDKWAWSRKKRYWKSPINIVCPSRWMAECVKQSKLMKDWPVTIIPNPIDTNIWKPSDRASSREYFSLPYEIPIILFGAVGGSQDSRKGFDLLSQALDILKDSIPKLLLVIFGQAEPRTLPELGIPVRYVGTLYDDISLSLLYSAADVMVNPARYEAFGQTASEAQACGTPVVSFNNSGLTDIVEHKETGYLAEAFDPADLAKGISWVLEASRSIKQKPEENYLAEDIREKSRKNAVQNFSYPVVAEMYKQAYIRAIENG